MTECIGFAPVEDRYARLLILGSLPGAQSLSEQQYYAKKANSFWRIMEAVLMLPHTIPYGERLAHLRAHHIALWDVCASAKRIGSLDSNIQKATIRTNDFVTFFQDHPHLSHIVFNGQHAERLFRLMVMPKLLPSSLALSRIILPSTSPAHARIGFEEKREQWRYILCALLQKEHGR